LYVIVDSKTLLEAHLMRYSCVSSRDEQLKEIKPNWKKKIKWSILNLCEKILFGSFIFSDFLFNQF